MRNGKKIMEISERLEFLQNSEKVSKVMEKTTFWAQKKHFLGPNFFLLGPKKKFRKKIFVQKYFLMNNVQKYRRNLSDGFLKGPKMVEFPGKSGY